MALQHLHLHVSDRTRSEQFYGHWFEMNVQTTNDEITFMTDRRAFLLALMQDGAAPPLPEWFHFGFRLESGDQVRSHLRRMREGGVVIRKPLFESDKLVSYRCCDPDGHTIEVYWQPI